MSQCTPNEIKTLHQYRHNGHNKVKSCESEEMALDPLVLAADDWALAPEPLALTPDPPGLGPPSLRIWPPNPWLWPPNLWFWAPEHLVLAVLAPVFSGLATEPWVFDGRHSPGSGPRALGSGPRT